MKRARARRPLPRRAREDRLEQAYAAALPIRGAGLRPLRRGGDGGASESPPRVGLSRRAWMARRTSTAVVRALAQRGVRQDGRGEAISDRRDAWPTRARHHRAACRPRDELVALARAAGGDRSAALLPMRSSARCSGAAGFPSEHGRQQRAIIDRLGRADGWRGDRRCRVRQVHAAGALGRCLAARRPAGLSAPPLPGASRMTWRRSASRPTDRALSVLLDRAEAGQVRLDRKSVVVVDELGTVGTRTWLGS